MSKERRTIARWMLTLLVAGLAASVVIFTGARVAKAHIVPFPCDFTTGGGFVITDNGYHANFGLVGGCKHDGFFGHVNFVDHDETGEYAGLHVSSDSIDAYFEPAPGSNVRDICGTADTNLFGTVKFRARTEDNSDPSPGRGVHKFGLKLTGVSPPYTGVTGLLITMRVLAGRHCALHQPERSQPRPSPPPDEITACGSDDSGLGY